VYALEFLLSAPGVKRDRVVEKMLADSGKGGGSDEDIEMGEGGSAEGWEGTSDSD
jgi:hypothetical protein